MLVGAGLAPAREAAEEPGDAPAAVQTLPGAQGEERRIETALGRFGHAHGERSQMFQAVWRAIVDHVPADGVIHVIVARDERVALTDKLRTLTYPRRFVPQRPPPGARAALAALTIASTSSVVMSAVTICSWVMAWPWILPPTTRQCVSRFGPWRPDGSG